MSTSRIRSSATRSRTSIPCFAALAVLIDTTSGIARPSAWGHAMTMTVTARSMTNERGTSARTSHPANVSAPTVMAVTVR